MARQLAISANDVRLIRQAASEGKQLADRAAYLAHESSRLYHQSQAMRKEGDKCRAEARKLSIMELARKWEVGHGYISNIVSGRARKDVK